MKASDVKIGDIIIIEGRTGDLGGKHTVVAINDYGITVKHPDYSISFHIDKDKTVYKINKK